VKFQSNKDVLASAIIFATKLIVGKNSNPLLSGIRIEATSDAVELSSFDHDVSTKTTIAAEVDAPGVVLVSGKMISDIVSRLPHEQVTLSLVDGKLSIASGSAKFSLATMPVADYPNLPELPPTVGTIDGEDFAQAIAQVGVAALRDDGQPAIGNISVELSADTISFTATDKYRIASRDIAWKKSGITDPLQVLVPARVLTEVGKMFHQNDEVSISLYTSGEKEIIALSAGDKVVTSSLGKGMFPHVRRLLDDKGHGESFAIVSASELIDATRRVSLVIDKDNALRYSFDENGVQLDAVNGENAQGSETVDIHLVGEPVVAWLKPKLFIDGLAGAHSQFVRLGFTASSEPGKAGPVLFTAHTSRDDASVHTSYRYLMQPNLLPR
jgi:DNA polymerase-3 subunit beta